MARKPFVKKQRPIPPNSRFNWDMLDVYRYQNEVLKEAREKVRSGEMTPEQARTWLQDEVEAATGYRPEVNKGRATAEQKAEIQRGVEKYEKDKADRIAAEWAAHQQAEAERKQQEAREFAEALAAKNAEKEKNAPR